ncbi:GNAT family N-acetyltransferase [Microbacterium sp. BWT-B31]|uniref:GNAT family N-acetyltransferase n=1 Tax=Microbacterium sp. BWT-B31 TaxID=3232072 RepID=UPI003529773B
MTIEVRAATEYDDVRTMVGPKDLASNVCWCLSYRRIPTEVNKTLLGQARAAYVEGLCRADPPPGVLAYDDGEVVGWAAVAPRSATSFSRSRKIPYVDDLEVWSVWCFRVRAGHRKQGIMHALLAGAVEFARAHDAPAIEGYPADTGDRRIDVTSGYVGTRRLFEQAGFRKAGDTASVLSGFPRVIMRLDLRQDSRRGPNP